MKRPRYRDWFRLRRFLFARLHGNRAVRYGIHRLERIVASYYNSGGSILRDGEDWLIAALLRHYRGRGESPVVLDIGANVGFWSYRWLVREPAQRLHCFEPVPATYAALRDNLRGCAGVRCHPVGLSDRNEEVEFYMNPKAGLRGAAKAALGRVGGGAAPGADSGAASRYRHRGGDATRCRVRLVRGEEYLAEQGIGRVHVLKVDAEGMDYRVLAGLDARLREGAVDVVQVETGLFGPDSRPVQDYYRRWGERYEIGRLYPRGVHFAAWPPPEEARWDGNYVLASRRCADLVGELRRAGR